MDKIKNQEKHLDRKDLPEKQKKLFLEFYHGYKKVLEKKFQDTQPYEKFLLDFIQKLQEQILSPYTFEPYHKRILSPFNYYQFGLDFLRPLIDLGNSTIEGENYLDEIQQKLNQKENVIFLANHQIEPDPQALSILLEKNYPHLAEEMISVAGDRVITDPLAIPFSMGRNLLCIYSKRYIDQPPELKTQKQAHNKKTMELMSELLSEGGHAIYVAPSGGRDRKNANGIVQVAPLDPQSIEMFNLMAKKASKPTSFYPMALSTYHILPPPDSIQTELGEIRKAGEGPIHLWIGPCIEMDSFPGAEELDKRKKRELRADFIWQAIKKAHDQFPKA